MNKLNILIMFPLLINLMMLLIMMLPSKINKFHPISLMIILIFITFLISFKMNLYKKSMIPFILFLIIIGGLMIIYMYITSLANNELFSFNLKILIMNMMKILPMIIIMIFLISNIQLIQNFLIESNQFNNFKENNFKYLNLLYEKSYNKSTYFIMIYLYYSMICIMNICYKLKNPLRQLLF